MVIKKKKSLVKEGTKIHVWFFIPFKNKKMEIQIEEKKCLKVNFV